MANVNKTESCWLWSAQIDKGTGYGKVGMPRPDGTWRMKWAHRVSYELHVAPIPDGLTIDHKCRVRACVNPDHLEPVTRKENILRGQSPAAIAFRRNTCIHGHEYAPDNTRIVAGVRQCKQCQRDWNRRQTIEAQHEAKVDDQLQVAEPVSR